MLKRKTKCINLPSKKPIKTESVSQLVEYFFLFGFIRNWYFFRKSSEQIHHWWRPVKWDYLRKWHHLAYASFLLKRIVSWTPYLDVRMLNSWNVLEICFYCFSQDFSEKFRKYVARKEQRVVLSLQQTFSFSDGKYKTDNR